MTKRSFLLPVIILLSALCASARNIPAGEALDRALQSVQSEADARRGKGNGAEYTLAYSAPTGSYHVFNRSTGGYIVASGDDEIYPVLADVGSGTFDMDSLAPAARWMLGEYDSQIRSFSTSDDADMGLADYYNIWGEIAPLMTTQWNQQYPYNKFCPVVGGRTCVTGCVATALAQVVRCIGYYDGKGYRDYNGVNSNGERVEFDYASATFDFGNMFDRYPASVTMESINEVGRLMLACGLGVSMNYGTSASGAVSENVPRALVDNFGYDGKHTRLYDNENYNQAQWENILHRQLELGRPVYYSGSGAVSHAFVIDGYRPAGLYHVNWGWGGTSDGYYRLTALNPTQTGIGGGTGGYNAGQQMVCAVPPGSDPGVVYGEMSGSISMVGEGTFALYYRSNGNNMFDVGIGAVIVDASGNIASTATFWQKQNLTAFSALRHDAYGYDFSQHELDPGDYRILPAFLPDGGEYVIADAFYNRPYCVNLTVTDDGRYIMSNEESATFEADIHVAGIVPGYDLHRGFSGSVGFYAVNNGNLDYEGTFRLALLDDGGEELAAYTSKRVKVAAGANATIYCPVPVFDKENNLIPAGTYPLRFNDGEGNLLSDGEFGIEIKKGSPLSQWEPEENIEVTNCTDIPGKLLRGDLWQHTPLIKTTQTHRNTSLELAFYIPSAVSPSHKIECYRGTIESMQSLFPLKPITVDAPLGTYEVCYRKGYTQISQRFPMRIGAAVGGMGYYPTDGDGVSVSLAEGRLDAEELIIPASVSIDGADRPVTEVEPEAFLMNRDVSVIDLPSGITGIGVNAFTACPSLRQIILRSEQPPFSLRNYIAPGLDASTEFYVTATAYDKYKPLLEGLNPLHTLVEEIESKEVTVSTSSATASLSLYPAHEAVNPAFRITPADEASAAVATVRAAGVEDGSLLLDIEPLQAGTATFHISPAHRADISAVLTVNVPDDISTGIADSGASRTAGSGIHSVSGVRMKPCRESLPAGIYIIDGNKVIVK